MTAVDILRAQHREVQALFRRLTSHNGDRAQAVGELSAKLRFHARLEEAIFYPALHALGTKRIQEKISESYEEHRLVDYLLTQLSADGEENETFSARLRVLRSLVEEHVEEEEKEVFKHAETLDDEERRKLDERMQETVQEVERVDELLGRVAGVARTTEQWAGSLLDASFELPRRAVSALAPSRWLPQNRRSVLAARIADAVPRVVVDSLYRTVRRAGLGRGRRAA